MTTFFHTKKPVMRVSVACRIRSDRQTKDGRASVYIQVIINSKATSVPLEVSWPVKDFDNKSGKFKERYKGDQEAIDFNLQSQKEQAKINDILMFYRHSDLVLTVDQFKKEYQTYDFRQNFITWVEQDNNQRYHDLKIEVQTWKNINSQMNQLREFQPVIKFNELNEEFLEKVEAWARKKEYSVNTIATLVRTIQSQSRKALKRGVGINIKSINEYTPPSFVNRIIYLRPDELERIEIYYLKNDIPESHKVVLGYFLFSCYTGLRFSDLKRVTWNEIDDGMLSFYPFKGRKQPKKIKVPLVSKTYRFIHNKRGKLFNVMAEQYSNRLLKDIAEACEVYKAITMHVGRHTFATEFLRRGGHVEVLQQLMGHFKITTTMIYVHVDTSRLREEMRVFD
ncbi:MAG: tyrosine-type recombinase/integrase [Cyclobacteriaceae bacterium]